MGENSKRSATLDAVDETRASRADINPRKNEAIANRIEKEWTFKLQRAPENLVTKVGLVKIILLLLQVLLIIHNNHGALGYWPSFLNLSARYREAFKGTLIGRAVQLDSPTLDAYSLWRGFVVPGFLSMSTYTVVSLLSLRHELYHWKPRLLQEYLESAKVSYIGKVFPESWLGYAFNIYESRHKKYISHKIQKHTYAALDDSKKFSQILKSVRFNLLVSLGVLLAWWMLLLQTNLDTRDVLTLPRSYVPPAQFVVWYTINDLFYFYPHWIAHTKKPQKAVHYRILPAPIADAVQNTLHGWHRAHHRSKAQLGVAAWYCSPWEHIFFNLIPALIGPLLTQILADATGVDHIWSTHLLVLYVWLMAATARSVLAHTGYRSRWNDPGKHDIHHERAFDPHSSVNFGTLGLFDWLHGTASDIPKADALEWRRQRDRQAALWKASKRTGVALTKEQREVVKQPDHSGEWDDRRPDE